MDRYEEMQTFVRIIDAGGISRAADQLDLVKSAVSRRLSDLETRLGVQLITRSTRKLTLTDTGRAYYDQCIRLLNDLEEVETSLSSEYKKVTGRLRISAPLSFGLAHLGPVINDFIKLYPQVTLDLDLNDREVNLVEDNFDLAIRIGSLKDSQLIARRIFTLNVVMVASPEYLQKNGTPLHPKELQQHHMIDYSLAGRDFLSYRSQKGEADTVKPQIIHSCSSGDFIREMAISGIGFALSPTFLVHKDIEQGRLIPFLCDYSWVTGNAYAIYPPTRHLSHRVRAFIDFLVERYEGMPYWDRCLNSNTGN